MPRIAFEVSHMEPAATSSTRAGGGGAPLHLVRNGTKQMWRLKTHATSIENYLKPFGEARLFEKPRLQPLHGRGQVVHGRLEEGRQKDFELSSSPRNAKTLY